MSRWLTRWRAALRIARRDALRSKGRTVLVVLLMMLPVAAGTFAIGVLRMSSPTPETQIEWAMGESAQARLSLPCGERIPTVQEADGSPLSCDGGTSLGPVTDAEWASVLPDGADTVDGAQIGTSIRSADALIDYADVIEVDAHLVPGLLGSVTGEPVPTAGEAILVRGVADRLGVGVGDEAEIDLAGDLTAVTVIGLGDSATATTGAVLGPGTIPDGVAEPIWFVVGDSPVSWADVVEINTIGLVVESRSVILDPPPDDVVYVGQFVAPGADTTMIGYVLAVGGLGLLEVVLLVGPAFAVGAKRSARSLALVAAAGGQPGDLRRIVLAGGVVAGLIAAVVGVVVGVVASSILFAALRGSASPMANLVFPVGEWVAVGAVALLLGLAAAWFPARAASRADVVTVLAGRRSEPPQRRGVPWVGLGVAVAGLVLGVVAATVRQPILLAVGAIAVEIGIIVSVGALVALVGRLAPRLGVAGRFALRDANRHRSRTTPAVAAVVAAVAAMTAGLAFTMSEDRAQENIRQPVAADGTGLLNLGTWYSSATEQQALFEDATAIVESELPDAALAPVLEVAEVETGAFHWPVAMTDPAQACPDPSLWAADAEDPRCRFETSMSAGFTWGYQLVDDGTWVSTLGLDGAEEAAAALASGHALTNDPNAIWPDGNVHISSGDGDPENPEEALVLPAHLVPWSSIQYNLVLPLDSVALLPADDDPGSTALDQGLIEVRISGGTITGVSLAQAEVDRVNRLLSDIGPNTRLQVEGQMHQQDSGVTTFVLLAIAAFVALAATGLSVGLALADSRADLATLAAVGASPRIRRRVTAAQAGVIAVIGTATGIVTGIALSFVVGRWAATSYGYGDAWQTIIPWQPLLLALAGIPVLAIAGGWLFTRSRLPVVRRIAS
ncbi:ABC transporter permease [Ruania alba]|uniref:Putative ABC transport system permease protein n=1 Tax=Ruania alba TaxID=648782 RepID=A0A1H5EWU9_9MICO|nr:ABC transporter permease [Ruania alba]SED95550.1 putative ABC transport system permease protein [Ruania alba]